MPETHHISPQKGDVLVLVGTMKGAFILRAGQDRGGWEIGGPYFPGSAVYALAYDGRAGRNRLWAGPTSMHWGGLLRSSGRECNRATWMQNCRQSPGRGSAM